MSKFRFVRIDPARMTTPVRLDYDAFLSAYQAGVKGKAWETWTVVQARSNTGRIEWLVWYPDGSFWVSFGTTREGALEAAMHDWS